MITQIRTYVEGQGVRFNLISSTEGSSFAPLLNLLPEALLPLLTALEIRDNSDMLLTLGSYGSILVDAGLMVKAIPSLPAISIIGTPSLTVLMPLIIGISAEMKPLINTIDFVNKIISMSAISPELDGYVITLEYPEVPIPEPEGGEV